MAWLGSTRIGRWLRFFTTGMAERSIEWTKKNATQRTRDYMLGLPFDISFSSNGRAVKIFHATPFKNNLYWHEERDDRFFLDMARRAATEVMIYGHTHIPYRKDIEGKVFINAGSVGKPKDGDPRACIAVVEILPDTVKSDFIRVPYDVERTATAVRESGLPAYFAEKLLEGK